jgi:hypothetical protein
MPASLRTKIRVPQSSPANPLPIAFFGAEFRCRQAWPNRNQGTDIQQIPSFQEALFGAKNAFFRCRQRDATV